MIRRIVFLGNNKLAVRVLSFLRTQPQEIVALVVHPRGKAKNQRQLMNISRLPKDRILLGNKINQIKTVRTLTVLKPDVLVSVMFGYILKSPVIATAVKGAINLHPAYLPYNRGAHPNVWSIIDNTPAGVTLHVINQGVDTGKILAQKRLTILPTDTGESLYQRLEDAAHDLFVEAWPKLMSGKIKSRPQPRGGSFHTVKDLQKVDEIDLNKNYMGRDLINLLRARTFPPYNGAYFKAGGRKIFVRIRLDG